MLGFNALWVIEVDSKQNNNKITLDFNIIQMGNKKNNKKGKYLA